MIMFKYIHNLLSNFIIGSCRLVPFAHIIIYGISFATFCFVLFYDLIDIHVIFLRDQNNNRFYAKMDQKSMKIESMTF